MADPYWVLLTGRGQGQDISIEQNAAEPKASYAGLSFSAHGPYSLAGASAYARSLGGQVVPLLDSSGSQVGSVDVATAKTVRSQPLQQDNSTASENKRVKAAGGTVGSVPNPLSGLAAIGDFFQRLTQANTWIRVGEVVLGVLLLGVGFARITGTQNAISKAVQATPAGRAVSLAR